MQGQVVAQRYRLVQQLGAGTMGEVWLAEHTLLGSKVAVKIIRNEMATHPEARGRFFREAQLAAQIASPYVVRVLDFGEGPTAADGMFMVLEYVEGQSLKERIVAAGKLPLVETVHWVTHVSRAMSVAHDMGLVHRDLKPANIFLARNADGTSFAKVLDFGVAKVPDMLATPGMDPTRTGTLLGTPYYMSPEQAEGARDLDHRSDLWALGVITFECLSGARPFTGSGLGQLIAKILAAPVPRLAQVVETTPAVDAWMTRALTRDRDGRFSSAQEMAQQLQTAAGVTVA